MTLSDLWPGFQGYDIFEVEYFKDKVTIAQETISNIWNGTMFCDLKIDWLINASRTFVSDSWVSFICIYSICDCRGSDGMELASRLSPGPCSEYWQFQIGFKESSVRSATGRLAH